MHFLQHGKAHTAREFNHLFFLPMINMKSVEMTPCPHHHNVRSAVVLEGIGDSARITNGSSTVRTLSMVELPIHVGSNKDSSTIYG